MRFTTLLRITAVITLLGFVALSTPAQDQNTDDVAAAARKAREQQKNAPKPKKVLTNDDIPSVPIPAESQPTASDKSADKNAGDKGTKDNSNSEAAWRARFETLRGKIASTQQEIDVMQRELDKDQVQYYNDPQKAMMQQLDRSDINDRTAKIAAKKKELESLQQQVSDLEDQLRKAGGDPGWARQPI